jgi:hypothetical protein
VPLNVVRSIEEAAQASRYTEHVRRSEHCDDTHHSVESDKVGVLWKHVYSLSLSLSLSRSLSLIDTHTPAHTSSTHTPKADKGVDVGD